MIQMLDSNSGIQTVLCTSKTIKFCSILKHISLEYIAHIRFHGTALSYTLLYWVIIYTLLSGYGLPKVHNLSGSISINQMSSIQIVTVFYILVRSRENGDRRCQLDRVLLLHRQHGFGNVWSLFLFLRHRSDLQRSLKHLVVQVVRREHSELDSCWSGGWTFVLQINNSMTMQFLSEN